jgi:hypothetical protein
MPDSTIPTEQPRGVNTTEGRALTGLPYGCPKLDWRVRLQTAAAFMVTYRMEGLALGATAFSAETFPTLKEALDFHEEIASGVRAGTAGVVIALREDGSVIGEVPTRRQEQAILARARKADLDYWGERAARGVS